MHTCLPVNVKEISITLATLYENVFFLNICLATKRIIKNNY